jgi:protein-S-isoprenylcysteine O-methyltransferase Ste14
MKVKMTMGGVGPKMAAFIIPYLLLTIILKILYPESFKITFVPWTAVLIIGLVWLIIGIIFYFAAIKVFFTEFKKGKLMTSGTYSLCRNPIYTTMILFIIPAAGLLTNSWLIMSTFIIGYIVFKLTIGKEYDDLYQNFGEEFIEYKNRVNEFFPFPRK